MVTEVVGAVRITKPDLPKRWCRGTDAGAILLFLLSCSPTPAEPLDTPARHFATGVHDPTVIIDSDRLVLFGTGRGISMWDGQDPSNLTYRGSVFKQSPAWTDSVLPGFSGRNDMWAPEIVRWAGRYYLYYSISEFGRNNSAIGVASNATLRIEDPKYEWQDHGKLIQSVRGRDQWNAIDPNVVVDGEGNPWMAFGSYWSGIKLVRLADNMVELASPSAEIGSIASRNRTVGPELTAGSGALEAPYIFRRGDYYYLFASIGICCRGVASTYSVVVGRSLRVVGPFLDARGIDMMDGGGTSVVGGDADYAGIGHNGIFEVDGHTYLVAHAYEIADAGRAKLFIAKLTWGVDGWPAVTGGRPELNLRK